MQSQMNAAAKREWPKPVMRIPLPPGEELNVMGRIYPRAELGPAGSGGGVVAPFMAWYSLSMGRVDPERPHRPDRSLPWIGLDANSSPPRGRWRPSP
jgi:hypothetical protein